MSIKVVVNIFGKEYAYDNGSSVPRAVSSSVQNGLIDTVWNLTGNTVASVDDALYRLSTGDKRVYDTWSRNAAENFSTFSFEVEMFNNDGQWWFTSTPDYDKLKELLAENCRNHIRRVRWVCVSDDGFIDTIMYDTVCNGRWDYTHRNNVTGGVVAEGYGDSFIEMCHSVAISVLERVYSDSHIYSVEV